MVNADFERCTDFLARMIEKYGGELDLPKTEENDMNDTTHPYPQFYTECCSCFPLLFSCWR